MTQQLLNQLDQAISKRIQLEQQFIDKMVQEFRRIKRDLDDCNARHSGPVSQDLGDISNRLGAAIQKLQNDPPIQASLEQDGAMDRAVQRALHGPAGPDDFDQEGVNEPRVDLMNDPNLDDSDMPGLVGDSTPVSARPAGSGMDELDGGWRSKRTRRRRTKPTKRTKRTKQP